MVRLALVGSCFHLAPPSRLGNLSASRDAVLARLVRLRREGVIAGGVLLRTCNRFEVLLDLNEQQATPIEKLVFEETPDVPLRNLTDFDAAEHLLRVAAGLESMVAGEDQIIGQMGRAFQEAEDLGLMSRRLHMLWSRVMNSARTLRSHRPRGGAPRSVAELAARVAREAGPNVAVIGAGVTGRTVAETLRKLDVGELWIVNRTFDRARSLANHTGGDATTIDAFLAEPPDVHAIVIAIEGRTIALPAGRMPSLSTIVDVSQPSVVDDVVRARPDLKVVDLDAVSEIALREKAELQSWLEQSGDLAHGHARRIWDELTHHRTDLGQLVQLHIENALSEVDRAWRGRLRELDDAQRDEVRRLVEKVAKRNAHLHLKDVRQLTVP